MLMGILTGPPIWVWPLLGLLILIGLISMRTRVTKVWPFYLLPLFAFIAMNSVSNLGPTPGLWGLFAASYGAGAILGWRIQPRWIISRDDRRVALKGEGLTIVMVLSVFVANFAVGLISALAPQIAERVMFQAGFVLIVGLMAGLFLGRAVAILKSPPVGLAELA